MAYNKYSANGIAYLNKNDVWSRTPITIKERQIVMTRSMYLYEHGECNLNGRILHIALPASKNINNSDIKKIQSYIT